jgi:hypothetical protein
MTRGDGLLTFEFAIRMACLGEVSYEPEKTRISPLRCAPVEMTKGRAVLPARVVAG